MIFSKADEGGFVAYVPDLCINTQGETLEEAAAMAVDAIGLVCADMERDGKIIPAASKQVEHNADEIVMEVNVDLAAYRAGKR